MVRCPAQAAPAIIPAPFPALVADSLSSTLASSTSCRINVETSRVRSLSNSPRGTDSAFIWASVGGRSAGLLIGDLHIRDHRDRWDHRDVRADLLAPLPHRRRF